MARLTFVSFVYAGLQTCLFAFLVSYLVERIGLDLVAAGLLYAWMQGAGVFARIFWGWLADRVGGARLILAALGLTGALTLTAIANLTAAWPPAAMVAVVAAAGVTLSGWNGVFLAEVARNAPPGEVGAATGAAVFFVYFGLVVGPAGFSLLVALTGSYGIAFYATAALAVLSALLLLPRPTEH